MHSVWKIAVRMWKARDKDAQALIEYKEFTCEQAALIPRPICLCKYFVSKFCLFGGLGFYVLTVYRVHITPWELLSLPEHQILSNCKILRRYLDLIDASFVAILCRRIKSFIQCLDFLFV
jgi:hypothetical protein